MLLAGLVLALGPGRDSACLASDDAGIQFVQSLSAVEDGFVPADDADWERLAYEEGSSFGESVATVGNVDTYWGDDVLVGAPQDGMIGEGGAAYLYLSTATGLETTHAWAASSDNQAARFGSSVAGAGDVNNDGRDDAIIGAVEYKVDLEVRPGVWQEVKAGAAFVYKGVAGVGLSDDPIWSYTGKVQDGWFASAVAGAGNLNGDEFDDIVVGASHYYDSDEQVREGAIYVFFGSTDGPSAEPDWMVDGDQSGAWLGAAVSAAGDVSGDGIDDLIVGAPKYINPETGLKEGAVFLFHGGTSPDSVEDAAWVVYGWQEGAEFGSSVAGVLDINGDGALDVLVSAPGYHRPSDGALTGAVFAFCGNGTGLDSDPCWSAHGDQPGGGFGASVAAAGDVNGDLYDDVIVGAPTYEDPDPDTGFIGAAFVYFGSEDGLSPLVVWKVRGEQSRSDFGFSVDSIADFDGDGANGVIIGAPEYRHLGKSWGKAFAFYGPLDPVPIYRVFVPLILRNSN